MPLSGQTVSWSHRRRVRLSFFLLVRASICSFGSYIFGSYVRDFAFRALRCARIRRSRSARFCDSRSCVLLVLRSATQAYEPSILLCFRLSGREQHFYPTISAIRCFEIFRMQPKGQRAKQGQTKNRRPSRTGGFNNP